MKIVAAIITLLSCANIGNGQYPISFLDSNCGISVANSGGPQFKILGGETADIFANPWMALILSDIFCGGSLITHSKLYNFIICYVPISSDYSVYLGEFDTSTATDCSTKACIPKAIGIPVDYQIRHPNYVNVDRHDIALFRLRWPVEYTGNITDIFYKNHPNYILIHLDFIRPICLPLNFDPLPEAPYISVTGWGKTEHALGSNVLKITVLTQADRSHCSRIYGRQVDMSHICAGDHNSHVCKGDSGGPVSVTFLIGRKNRTMQVGIVSYGDVKCTKWSVFTNVIYHMNWIKNTVQQWQGY
ncbi:hypothetical protein KR084_006198 [Drosophila pseudotakahashii]|nr:hypothetical protein KR084_006198 [Drosophila pseudotakahashii]